MGAERNPDDVHQSDAGVFQKDIRPGLRRIPGFVWALLPAGGYGLLLTAMGLKGAFPSLPDEVFWTICVVAVTMFSVAVLMWSGRQGSRGLLTPYRTPEEGIRHMELWKWRLRQKAIHRAVNEGQQDRDRDSKEPPAP